MKKKLISRGILGFPIGITIGYCITILVSLIWADGYYSPCMPALTLRMGNEINAVILQAILCGLLGVSFSASSIIWEIAHWNMVKQTGVYFFINAIIMITVAYCTYWMEHSIAGFLSYFGIFITIFIIVWIIEFITSKYIVKKMNQNLPKTKNSP